MVDRWTLDPKILVRIQAREIPLKMNINIRLILEEDLARTAEVYKRAFNEANVGEEWTQESAQKFILFWLKTQPDLFFIAEKDGAIVGGIVGLIKPVWDGNHLMDTEFFVISEFQGQGIGKKLLSKLLSEAINKYQITVFNGLTFKDAKFPLEWYKRIGLKESNLVYLEGNPKEILENISR